MEQFLRGIFNYLSSCFALPHRKDFDFNSFQIGRWRSSGFFSSPSNQFHSFTFVLINVCVGKARYVTNVSYSCWFL